MQWLRYLMLWRKKKKLLLVFGLSSFLVFTVMAIWNEKTFKTLQTDYDIVLSVLRDFHFGISKDVNNVELYLWTRKNHKRHQKLIWNDSKSLSKTFFNKSHPTKILVHGFSDFAITTWTTSFRRKYLNKGEYNIISVDWNLLASSPWYTTAAKNAKNVGKRVAEFVDFLISEGASYDDFHVVGSSLGSQTAGYIGHFTGGKIARITGLDPSGPLFHFVPRSDRLDYTDARFVDVVHSAGRWVGNDDTIGHVDFYINGGKAPQPGCEDREFIDLSCSHFMSWLMYEETIFPDDKEVFIGVRCDSAENFYSGKCCREHDPSKDLILFGEYVNTSYRGRFYLATNNNDPHMYPLNQSIGCVPI